MGQALVDQVEASVEEAVSSATWTDIQVLKRLSAQSFAIITLIIFFIAKHDSYFNNNSSDN